MEKAVIALTPEANTHRTHRVGTIEATYSYLVSVLGEPHFNANDYFDGKVTAEWILTIQTGKHAGQVVTIYDYKLYDNDEGITDIREIPNFVYDWSLGGNDPELEPIIYNALGIK